ncbi:hypothetical protein [Thermus albus]|uniref:hypothetical protein n=1 Tax=Thermus albus TaxID=2908146 RepID=UPI001FAA64AA|nr:hypothetical protein [Thermus albus]
MNLKRFEPDRYKALVVAAVWGEREKVLARGVGTLREARDFLERAMEEGADLGEITWVVEEGEDYLVEHKVKVFLR